MSRTTVEVLQDALAHFEIMQSHAEQGLEERLVIDAVCMRLSAGIETLAALDPTVREEIFGEVWPLMWGMRNRIAHGYLLVDTTIINQTLIHDVPAIMSRLRLGVDLDRSPAVGGDHPTAGESAHVDLPLDDTGPVRSPRGSGIDGG